MLANILQDLIKQAKSHKGKTALRKLQSGLFVFMRWEEPMFTMTLSRESTFPSPVEMRTCINALPATVEKPSRDDAIRTNYNSRPSLRVDFAATELVQKKMFE